MGGGMGWSFPRYLLVFLGEIISFFVSLICLENHPPRSIAPELRPKMGQKGPDHGGGGRLEGGPFYQGKRSHNFC